MRNLLEAEMVVKDQTSSSTKQKVRKEVLKLVDLVRIAMQMEEENFTEFFLNRVFVLVKDSNSLNFHNFLIELCKNCELPDEILENCKENLERLKNRGKEKVAAQKTTENIASSSNLSNVQINNTEFEKTVSTTNAEGFPILSN